MGKSTKKPRHRHSPQHPEGRPGLPSAVWKWVCESPDLIALVAAVLHLLVFLGMMASLINMGAAQSGTFGAKRPPLAPPPDAPAQFIPPGALVTYAILTLVFLAFLLLARKGLPGRTIRISLLLTVPGALFLVYASFKVFL
ncbi:hypothetical protein HQ520_12970 [bacterium]|nr:hypothetical protein [bacterium]